MATARTDGTEKCELLYISAYQIFQLNSPYSTAAILRRACTKPLLRICICKLCAVPSALKAEQHLAVEAEESCCPMGRQPITVVLTAPAPSFRHTR